MISLNILLSKKKFILKLNTIDENIEVNFDKVYYDNFDNDLEEFNNFVYDDDNDIIMNDYDTKDIKLLCNLFNNIKIK